ncbi:MAG: 30S ribosomal protein S13 [Patescibacteria group bacterium]
MPRVAGVNIPDDKQIDIALTYIYGIGRSLANDILDKAGVDSEIKANEASKEDLSKIRKIIEKDYKVEGELKRERRENVDRLKRIDCYRGRRHKKGLPVRGQRTRTNSRTVRGNVRRTAGSGRKAAPQAK